MLAIQGLRHSQTISPMPLKELPAARKSHHWSTALRMLNSNRYGVVTALYNVIWSYIGYSNANYALSETKNPVRTLKIAAPLALGLVSILYMLVNVSPCCT